MRAAAFNSDIAKVQKLRQLVADLRGSQQFEVTRLTVLKSLGKDPDLAHRFASYLAKKVMMRLKQGQERKSSDEHKCLMKQPLTAMKTLRTQPAEAKDRMRELREQMRQQQNEHRNVPWTTVRIIHDWNLFMIESALECFLRRPRRAAFGSIGWRGIIRNDMSLATARD